MKEHIAHLDNSDETCEALNCFARATDKVVVKVGDLGAITLLLCKKCMIRFEDN